MSFFANTAAQQPKEEKKFANISDDAVNSNQQGVPVKYLAGRNYVAGDYITPAYNPVADPVKTKAGKGSDEQITGYIYYADFALVFCMGGVHPVDAIYKIIVDSEIVWSGAVERGDAASEIITVPDFGTARIYWGNETQGINSTLLQPREADAGDTGDATTWDPNPPGDGDSVFGGFASGDPNPFSGHYDYHPSYRGQCYAVFKNWKLGRDRTSIPNIQFELKRGAPWFGGASIDSDNRGVNPIAVLFDLVTDPRFGMEFPEARLNAAQWISAYNGLNALQARISPVISEQSDFRQVVAQLLEYFDGWLRREGNLLSVGFWSHGTIVSSGTLTDDDLLGEPELEPQGWGPTVNEVTVIYKERDHNYNDYTQVYRDANNRRVTGSPRQITIQRPWITDGDLAKQYATEYGHIHAQPFTRGVLHVKREWLTANNMLPGKIFLYASGFYRLQFYLRLLEIEYAADNSAKASITVEWERSIWPSLYIPPAFRGPGGILLGPRPIWQARITEVPYLLLDHRFATQIAALAVKGNVEVRGFRVWASFDSGDTYTLLKDNNQFAAFGILYASFSPGVNVAWFTLYGIGFEDTVVTQNFDEFTNDTLLLFLDSEIMSVGNVTGYGNGLFAIAFLRARMGTSQENHYLPTPAYFIRREDLGVIDNASFVPGTNVLFKLQPFTVDESYDLTTIDPISYDVSGWAPINPPILDPPPRTFESGVWVIPVASAGLTIRYTIDGTPVYSGSRLIGGGVGIYTTTTLRVRAFADDGRYSSETIGTYTKVASGASGPEACGIPLAVFSGTRGQTGGNLTLTPATSGSTVHFSKNGGSDTTYTAPISLVSNDTGDTVEYWAEKTGLDDSPSAIFNNTFIGGGGGGGWFWGHQQQPP